MHVELAMEEPASTGRGAVFSGVVYMFLIPS